MFSAFIPIFYEGGKRKKRTCFGWYIIIFHLYEYQYEFERQNYQIFPEFLSKKKATGNDLHPINLNAGGILSPGAYQQAGGPVNAVDIAHTIGFGLSSSPHGKKPKKNKKGGEDEAAEEDAEEDAGAQEAVTEAQNAVAEAQADLDSVADALPGDEEVQVVFQR